MGRKKRKKQVIDLNRVFRYLSFVVLFSVFFVVMFNLLPHEPSNSNSLIITGNFVGVSENVLSFEVPLGGQFSIFAIIIVAVVGLLLYIDQGPKHHRIALGQQELEQSMRQAAYAVRSKNKPRAQQLYRKIYKSYHKLEPHSHHCNKAIHVIHKKMSKLK